MGISLHGDTDKAEGTTGASYILELYSSGHTHTPNIQLSPLHEDR